MPNPKAGLIVPPNASLKALSDKLQSTVRVKVKSSPVVHCAVGKEDMDEALVVDNYLTVYNAVMHRLPNEEYNVKSAYLKLTMGSSVRVK
jgi:ribosomal protein L1